MPKPQSSVGAPGYKSADTLTTAALSSPPSTMAVRIAAASSADTTNMPETMRRGAVGKIDFGCLWQLTAWHLKFAAAAMTPACRYSIATPGPLASVEGTAVSIARRKVDRSCAFSRIWFVLFPTSCCSMARATGRIKVAKPRQNEPAEPSIYILKSGGTLNVRAFTSDPTGANLPSIYGPWEPYGDGAAVAAGGNAGQVAQMVRRLEQIGS